MNAIVMRTLLKRREFKTTGSRECQAGDVWTTFGDDTDVADVDPESRWAQIVESSITNQDIERSRADPRFKQVLLAKVREQLLAALYRLQHAPANADADDARDLREGALMAVQLADLIRSIDDSLKVPVRH